MKCPACGKIELELIEAMPEVGIDQHFYCWRCDKAFDPWLFYDENY